MAISGSDQAYLTARSGIARSGASRSNALFPDLFGVITVGGVNLTSHILYGSLQIHLEINDQPDTASFQVFITDAAIQAAIVVGADVVIGLGGPTENTLFGGRIITAQTTRNPAHVASLCSVMCADYLQVVDSEYLITYGWPSQSATTTILDLVARFTGKSGGTVISPAGVQAGLPTHQAFGVINERFSTVLRRMVTMFPTPGGFYIDATKVLRAWAGKPEPGQTSPLPFTLANPHLKQFAETVDGASVRDAVIVEGRRTTAPLGSPGVNPALGVPTLVVSFPVVDASILDPIYDTGSPREIRVGSMRLLMQKAVGPWAVPDGTPTATSVSADVAFSPGAGTVSIPVVSLAPFPPPRLLQSWVKIDEQYLFVASTGASSLNVLRQGFGAMTGPIKAGAAVSVMDYFETGSTTGRYDSPAGLESVRAQPRESDVVMTVRSATPPAVHEQIVQDGRYVISGATNRGTHEITDFGSPSRAIQFATTDLNARPGRVQTFSFVDPPLATMTGDFMILTADISWPVWGELPLRVCTAANVGAVDIVDAWLVDPR